MAEPEPPAAGPPAAEPPGAPSAAAASRTAAAAEPGADDARGRGEAAGSEQAEADIQPAAGPQGAECAVCFEPAARALGCQHAFCDDCLRHCAVMGITDGRLPLQW